jgi:hypothetical protein
VLSFTLPSGVSLQLPLAPRYARFLFSLVVAWQEDAGQIEQLRGIRTKAEIAELIAKISPAHRLVDPETVPVYVYEIRALILKTVKKLHPVEEGDPPTPPLLENQWGIGYRIGPCGLDVVRFRSIPKITE